MQEGVCAGAGAFLGYAGLCCLLVVIAPLVLVYAVHEEEPAAAAGQENDPPFSGPEIAAIASLAVGLLFCLWGLAPALAPPPKAPEPHGPL